ncbi:hypothetical protein EsDP_00001336 [Epichloe bromicola]|uniref:Uncharacterized protein n=1 Tax=Epichloe bromicola TaxID=79588 RepID=A0ABQ0CHJ2_9HYPO
MARDNSQGTQPAGGNRGRAGHEGFAGPGRGNPQQRWHGVGVRRRRPRNNNEAQRDRGHEQRLINQGILPEVEQIAFSATTNQSGQVTSAIAVNTSRNGGRQVNVQARVDNVATGSRAVITNSGSALGTVADTVMAETGAPSVFAAVRPMNVAVFREQAIQSTTTTHRMFLGDSRIMVPAVSRRALPAPASVAPAEGSIRRHRDRRARRNRRDTQGPLNPEAASLVPATGSVAETGAPSVFASVMPMNVAVFREQAIQSTTSMQRMLLGDGRLLASLASRPARPASAADILRRRRDRRALQNRRDTQRPLNPEAASFVPATGSAAVAAVDNGPAPSANTDAAMADAYAPPPLTGSATQCIPGLQVQDDMMVDAPPAAPPAAEIDIDVDYVGE